MFLPNNNFMNCQVKAEVKSILIGTILLVPVFIVCYALQWVLWKWLWLAVPIWIVTYFIGRNFSVINNLTFGKSIKVKRTYTTEEIRQGWKKMAKSKQKKPSKFQRLVDQKSKEWKEKLRNNPKFQELLQEWKKKYPKQNVSDKTAQTK
jgi:hypothetical protein